MAKSRRNKNNDDPGTPGRSPNDRAKTRGQTAENDANASEKDEEMDPKRLFDDNASSSATETSTNSNTDNNNIDINTIATTQAMKPLKPPNLTQVLLPMTHPRPLTRPPLSIKMTLLVN